MKNSNRFLVPFSYLFHPLFIPLMGTLLYLWISPNPFSRLQVLYVCLQVSLLTILIPIVFYFWLKSMGKADSVMLEKSYQRKIPLLLGCALLYLLGNTSITANQLPELHYFIWGGMISNGLAFLYLFMRVKASLHLLGTSALCVFVMGLSLHHQVDLTYLIAGLLLLNGLVASSRLALRAHTYTELAVGFGLGAIPQLALWWIWL